MPRSAIIFISSFLIVCLNYCNSSAQYGYTLLDSCIDYYESEYSRTYLIISDSGNYTVTQTLSFPPAGWTTIGSNNILVFSQYNLYDSLGRIIECDRLQDSIPPLQFYSRTLFSYDSLGNMNDSLEQTFIANTWVNSNRWTWKIDSASNPVFKEWKSWSSGQWLNKTRKEWFYDSFSRDTLNIAYTGDTNNWIPQYKNQFVFSSFGLADSFNTYWNGTTWINQFQGQFFYQSMDQDTLNIFYNGNINTWDSSKMVRNAFDSLGNKIYSETLFYVASNWVSQTRSFYSYDSLHRVIIEIGQIFDTLGWQNDFKDSICFNNNYDIEKYKQYWNGTSWYCSEFDFRTGNRVVTGGLNLNCTIDSYTSDQTIVYDSSGRIIYFEYDGHAGQSFGASSYFYDDVGFLYKSISFSSTMGGILNSYNCIHYRPLVFSFDQYFYNLCSTDSVDIFAHTSGGAYAYHYNWRFNNQILTDTLPILSGFSTQHSGWLILTLSDTARNYYIDSVFLQIDLDVNLGNDTIVCHNETLTLSPGNYSSFLWQDGSSLNSFSASSPTIDTVLFWVQISDSTGCTSRDSLTVIFDFCQLISVNDKSEFNIFPNPTTGFITILFPDLPTPAEVTITNIFGQVVKKVKSVNTSLLELEIIGESGLYIVKVEAEKKSGIYRILKM